MCHYVSFFSAKIPTQFDEDLCTHCTVSQKRLRVQKQGETKFKNREDNKVYCTVYMEIVFPFITLINHEN